MKSLLEKIKSKITRKQIIIFVSILLVILLYCLFWKPNPIIRLNLNKFRGSDAKAVLYIDAPTEVSNAGKTLSVKIMLDTKGNSVNAVQSILKYDNETLEIVSTNTKDSFCTYYPENSYNNEIGEVRLSCGTPYPGFKGTNTLEIIEFLTKATKTTKLEIDNKSMVLANDGKGTNLLKEFDIFSIKIKPTL